jgi:hypothetical protein
MTSAIYRKTFVLSVKSRQKYGQGDITNLQTVDAKKVEYVFPYIQVYWSAPLNIIGNNMGSQKLNYSRNIHVVSVVGGFYDCWGNNYGTCHSFQFLYGKIPVSNSVSKSQTQRCSIQAFDRNSQFNKV